MPATGMLTAARGRLVPRLILSGCRQFSRDCQATRESVYTDSADKSSVPSARRRSCSTRANRTLPSTPGGHDRDGSAARELTDRPASSGIVLRSRPTRDDAGPISVNFLPERRFPRGTPTRTAQGNDSFTLTPGHDHFCATSHVQPLSDLLIAWCTTTPCCVQGLVEAVSANMSALAQSCFALAATGPFAYPDTSFGRRPYRAGRRTNTP
jgi:hypothetical protein